jgi:L-alanine-DL-glutamate epimerase-like enolase superfamily enzyme
MKIVGIDTLQTAAYGNLVWVRIHTDEGVTGLGETFRNPEATIAYIHETCAPFLIGKDPTHREKLAHSLARRIGNHFNGFPGRSVEVRGNSAVDMALWDLCGKAFGLPIYRLLGGPFRTECRIYNTCAGGSYNNQVRQGYNTELLSRDDPPPPSIGRYEDLLLQVYEPAQLARELVEAGIMAMKIWPFDVFALRNGGAEISGTELHKAIWPIDQIRKEVGDAMDILIEYHGLWQLPAALKIAKALKDYDIYWHEEPVWMQNFDDVARYRDKVNGQVAGSENLGSLPWYREMFVRGAVDVANFDIAWVGGISEAQRIAHLAASFDRAIAPHDCTGPVTLLANVHLLAAYPHGLIAETVRAHTNGFYADIVTELPRIRNGFISPTESPGIGAELSSAFLARADLKRRLTGRSAVG